MVEGECREDSKSGETKSWGGWMTIVAMGGGRSGMGKSGSSWRGCAAGEEDDRWEEDGRRLAGDGGDGGAAAAAAA